jgi:hypothetical protein
MNSTPLGLLSVHYAAAVGADAVPGLQMLHRSGPLGQIPLMRAIEYRLMDCVKALVRVNPRLALRQVEMRDEHGVTVLTCVAQTGDEDMFTLLRRAPCEDSEQSEQLIIVFIDHQRHTHWH